MLPLCLLSVTVPRVLAGGHLKIFRNCPLLESVPC